MVLNKYLVRWDSFLNHEASTYGCFVHEQNNRLELHPTIVGECGGFTEVRRKNGHHKYLYLGLPANIYQKSDLPQIESELQEWLSLLDFGSGVQYIGLGNMPSYGTLLKDNIIKYSRFYQGSNEMGIYNDTVKKYLENNKGISNAAAVMDRKTDGDFTVVKGIQFTEDDLRILIPKRLDYAYDRSRNVAPLPFNSVDEIDKYLISEMREPLKPSVRNTDKQSHASKVHKSRDSESLFFVVRLSLDDLPIHVKGYLFYVTYIRMFYRQGYSLIPNIVSRFVQQSNTALRGASLVKAAICATDLFSELIAHERHAIEVRSRDDKDTQHNKLEYVFGIKDDKLREKLLGKTMSKLGDQFVADFIQTHMENVSSTEDEGLRQQRSLTHIFNYLVEVKYLNESLRKGTFTEAQEYTRNSPSVCRSEFLRGASQNSVIFLSDQVIRKRGIPTVMPLYKVTIEGITKWEGDSTITVDDSQYHWWNRDRSLYFNRLYDANNNVRSPYDIVRHSDIRIGYFPNLSFLVPSGYGPIDKASVVTCGQIRKMAKLMKKSPVVPYGSLYGIYTAGDNAMHSGEMQIARHSYYADVEDFSSKFGGSNTPLNKMTASKMYVDSTYPLNLVPDFEGHPLELTVELLERVNSMVETLMVKHLTDKKTVVAVLALDKDTAVIGLINI